MERKSEILYVKLKYFQRSDREYKWKVNAINLAIVTL